MGQKTKKVVTFVHQKMKPTPNLMKLKILFVINPISGIGKQKTVEKLIDTHLNKERFVPEICYTQYAGHAIEIARQAVGKYDIVTAIGGDGSINETASQLVGTETALAVIPCGSGNGFARTLNIPLKPEDAVKHLNTADFKTIDTCTVNDKFFISIAGTGFDSVVAAKYEQMPGRGFKTYFKAGFGSFFNYKEDEYTLLYNGIERTERAFLITACNSTQYGYNFRIAPQAVLDDGLLDVAIVRRPPLWRIPYTAAGIMLGRAHRSKYIDIVRCPSITIKGSTSGYINLDGETVECKGDLVFKVAGKVKFFG